MDNNNTEVKETTKFEIPIHTSISKFDEHLRTHARTIFSAKFGDGKTYFLDKFTKIKDDNYKFITIHPINYQVISNYDIFEIVKRDILFQMTQKGMIERNYEVPNSTVIQYLMLNNPEDLVNVFIPFLSLMQADSKLVKSFLVAYQTYNLYIKLRDKIKLYKDNCSRQTIIEEFINNTDDIPIASIDIVSTIIYDNIKKWQDKTNQKVVLVFEDMDRIDPAHLFRIMNVLSAQVDLPSYYSDSNNSSFNKFGFDNIILVLDYENLKNLFFHVYGNKTNFEGYIAKFVPDGYFPYSLSCSKYIYEYIKLETNLPSNIIEKYITTDIINNKSLRIFSEALNNIDLMIKDVKIYGEESLPAKEQGIIRLFAILKILGIDVKELTISTKNIMEDDVHNLNYFVPYFVRSCFPKYREFSIPTTDRYKEYVVTYLGYSHDKDCFEFREKGDDDVSIKRFRDYNGIVDSLFNYISQ